MGLELTDPGFDFSVLCEFRARLISGGAEQQLLDTLLQQFKERGWIKARGKQRTDSTHVLAAIRTSYRLETVGETLRSALNAIATVDPDWLRAWVPKDWFERYGRAVDEYRLPKGIPARQAYAETIGLDGMELLIGVWADISPTYLRRIPEVEVLRQTWVHQYYVEKERVRLRVAADLAPTGNRFDSPYDTEARYGNKRSVTWIGYKVHLTETCDKHQVHLITHAITTQAQISDVTQTASIHRALATKALLPSDHIVDAGYVDSNLIVTSRKTEPRELTLRPKAEYLALQTTRQQQQTTDWKKLYDTRAGVEGTLSQAIGSLGLRQTRYIGLVNSDLAAA